MPKSTPVVLDSMRASPQRSRLCGLFKSGSWAGILRDGYSARPRACRYGPTAQRCDANGSPGLKKNTKVFVATAAESLEDLPRSLAFFGRYGGVAHAFSHPLTCNAICGCSSHTGSAGDYGVTDISRILNSLPDFARRSALALECAMQGSNLRLLACEASALPLS